MKTLCISFLLLLASWSQAQQTKNFFVSEESKAAAKEKIEGYRQRVLDGESMSAIATLYSEDPGSVKTGGRYDNIARGQFVPEFESVAFRMEPGEISEIFETQYGFHFIQLIAKHDNLVDLRHILVKPK
jgi:peptidyl-prolyl cis-trans isomerase SurA